MTRELQRLDVVFRQACDVQTRDRVLDVGCGTGQTTRAAALAAHDGSALGVDSSAPAVERARGFADAAGLGNVAFERGDAQVHPFAGETFDLAISRFGTMFFHDAGAAFTNLARALRPAGRLVMLVWQAGDRNEWDVAIQRALAGGAQPSRRRRRSRSRTRPGRPRSSRPRGSSTSTSPTSRSRSATAPTWRQPRRGSAASPAPASCWDGSIPTARNGARSTAGDAVGTPARRRRVVRLTGVDRQRALGADGAIRPGGGRSR